MTDWIPSKEFEKTEYGKLNKILDGKNFFGKLDTSKMPPNSRLVKDPKDGFSWYRRIACGCTAIWRGGIPSGKSSKVSKH